MKKRAETLLRWPFDELITYCCTHVAVVPVEIGRAFPMIERLGSPVEGHGLEQHANTMIIEIRMRSESRKFV